jgi:biotin transporter BioY
MSLQKVKIGALSLLAAAGTVVAVAPVANATDYGISMTQACKEQYDGYYASYLVSSNVYGWRCRNSVYDNKNIDLALHCTIHYSGSPVYLDFNNPYSWRCRV